jgi:hypothetical protein
MKSTLAFAALSLSTMLFGCGSAPESEIGSGQDEWTARAGSLRDSLTVVASTGTTSAATTNSTMPARVYSVPTRMLPNALCVDQRGSTGVWRARNLGKAPTLSGYCVLEWVESSTPDVNLLPREARTDSGKAVYGDRPIVAPLAPTSALTDASWYSLEKAMRIGSGADGAPVQLGASRAFVAAVDSAKRDVSTGEASTGTYEHGELVGRIARTLGGGTNPLAVLSTTALPRLQSGVASASGGYYGYTTDVALAIVDAVDAWRSITSKDKPIRPLVINLSMGWDTVNYAGSSLTTASASTAYTDTSVTNHPQRNVFLAIQYANCAGALVLSAAGNKAQGSPANDTLMLPAAWESVPAPTAARCEAFGLATRSNRIATDARMTYAIGGVDGADKPLFNSRRSGQPRLVAYGDAVSVARSAAIGGHTGVMTGTSIATAVASSIAAYAWSFAPTYTGHDIAAIMYAKSPSLGSATTACSYGSACDTRRLALCEVASAVRGISSTCGTVAPYAGSKVRAGITPASLASFTKATSSSSLASATAVNSVVNPQVRPMPGSGGCSLCGLSGTTAYFDISYPSSTIGAELSWYGGGFSFTPDTQYISYDLGLFASFATITFSDPYSGWTSTEQLIFF